MNLKNHHRMCIIHELFVIGDENNDDNNEYVLDGKGDLIRSFEGK